MKKMTGTIILVFCLIALSGCDHYEHKIPQPELREVYYYAPEDSITSRRVEKYTSYDGSRLAYVVHDQPAEKTDTAIVYLHGIESHSGWFYHAADLLARKGCDVYCLDRRGSGLNREDAGYISGDIESYETLFQDIKSFAESLQGSYKSVYLAGLSWGGKLALGYALSHPQTFDGLIMITPGIVSRVDLALGAKLGVLVNSGIRPMARVKIPIEPEMFTKTPRYLELIRSDELRLHDATSRFLIESNKLENYVLHNSGKNQLPVLVFLAGNDRIIDNEAVMTVILDGAEDIEVHLYADQTHSIQFDAAPRLVGDITHWLEQRGGR